MITSDASSITKRLVAVDAEWTVARERLARAEREGRPREARAVLALINGLLHEKTELLKIEAS